MYVTPINSGQKCPFRTENENFKEKHVFTVCKTLKKRKIELPEAVKEIKRDTVIDINRPLTTTIYPGNDKDWTKVRYQFTIIEHLIWNLFLKQMRRNTEIEGK